ncbi:restriction endonuclease subunit S [Megasphaera sp. DJF_B143]|uniref:restriction endonuclease subunit S n=1 Tax=Megasphaera sp. DJF_B143 TaxID=537288 RepID=UPI0008A949B3|nr:restriction endonuclease subunit S [Megasphaera sp. DJF_B143]
MALTKIRLGDYIQRSTINNRNLEYGVDLISGVSTEGIFTKPKGNPIGVDLKPYKIVNTGALVYNPTRLNLGSIAYRTGGLCIVSHLYMVFYLNENGKKTINPIWLYMYFRRSEFYREVTFRNFGSQRPEFNFNDLSDLVIPIPPLAIQQKYVDVYQALLANQKNYEEGLDDLKLTCDAYIEELRRKIPYQKIGPFLERHDVRNGKNGTTNVMGISTSKEFRQPTSKVDKKNLSNYKVVKPGQIGFVQTTHNEKVFAYAFNNTDKDIVISPVDEVFSTDKKVLLPEYLCMWFNRKEFDRYARFHSWGSARETFTWNDLTQVQIPIPDLKLQKAITDIYNAYKSRKYINDSLKERIKKICPILIKGSLDEGERCRE